MGPFEFSITISDANTELGSSRSSILNSLRMKVVLDANLEVISADLTYHEQKSWIWWHSPTHNEASNGCNWCLAFSFDSSRAPRGPGRRDCGWSVLAPNGGWRGLSMMAPNLQRKNERHVRHACEQGYRKVIRILLHASHIHTNFNAGITPQQFYLRDQEETFERKLLLSPERSSCN